MRETTDARWTPLKKGPVIPKASHTWRNHDYRQTSNASRTLVGNKIVDHPDVVAASPIGAISLTKPVLQFQLSML